MKLRTAEQIAALVRRRNPYQPLDSAAISEPRVGLIASRLRALLEVVQLESGGTPLEIDGFRLRDPSQWRTRVGSPVSELWHISTACNMRCPFCYEEGDPTAGSVLNEPAEMTSVEEIEARLRYRDPASGTGMFQPLTYINEIFCNPRALDIMARLRAEQPNEVLSFVTNGTYLTETFVARLAELKPVFFNFSVNSLDPVVRRRILRDLHPEVAIRSLELLREYGIPYLGSLVCWPTIPFDDVRRTVRALDRAGCAVIRFSLSAYSRFLKGRRFERETFWAESLAVARELMQEVETPIKVEPYHYADPSYLPHVAGVVRGSPAHAAGVRAGDLIVAVEGSPVRTANQALGRLARTARRSARVTLELRRAGGGEPRRVLLDDAAGPFPYPYGEMGGFRGFEWGVFLVDNIPFSSLRELRELIDRHRAKRVLLCSSQLMKPIAEEMLAESGAFADVEMHVEVPPNRFFGGTVVLGDLLVVDDYVRFIRERLAGGLRPDLVLIPSSPFSLGEWHRDLTGAPFLEIARRTGVPVEMVYCRPLQG